MRTPFNKRKVSTLETKVQDLEEKTTTIYDYKGSVLFEKLTNDRTSCWRCL